MKGWIALDVDGTLTDEKYSIPQPVVDYLNDLAKEWKIAIVTGRSFSFARASISKLGFPFLFFVQNGSLVLKMPREEIYLKSYMDSSVIASIEKAFEGIEGVMLVYSGYDQDDQCFWREGVTKQYEKYLKKLHDTQEQKGRGVKKFSTGEIPLIKCIGKLDKVVVLAERLRRDQLIQFSLIKDPFDENFYILMVTKKGVSKGEILKKVIEKENERGVVIVAGNDDNDFSMFDVANIKIAMPSSPPEMLNSADFVAPPVEEFGIISALELAIKRAKSS